MKSSCEGKTTVYRKDFEWGTSYSIGMSKKRQDGTWLNWYKQAKFKKGTDLPDKTKINVTRAWMDCDEGKDGKKYEYIFIGDFEIESIRVNDDPKIPEGMYAALDDDQMDIPF